MARRRQTHRKGERIFTEAASKPCKRCGSATIAWRTGNSGKWYLTELFEDAEGRTYTEHTEFHSKYCNDPEEHELEQEKRLNAETKDMRESYEIRKKVDERNAADEADYFLAIHDLCKSQPDQARDQLYDRERERDRITFWEDREKPRYKFWEDQEKPRYKRLTAEIAFMRAALGMATDYDDE